MYKIFIETRKVEKDLRNYVDSRGDVRDKLKRLTINPFRECGAHSLRGKLKGKWSCLGGSNIRMIYRIDIKKKVIYVESVGSHKIY